jgi:hypothetical protein
MFQFAHLGYYILSVESSRRLLWAYPGPESEGVQHPKLNFISYCGYCIQHKLVEYSLGTGF